jgi:IclR family acetate operon transcriptional repressor
MLPISARPKREYNIIALQRGLRILQLFAASERGLTAGQVAKLSGLPVSTVHRFLMNLESSAFLNCSESGIYHLGLACLSIGQTALGQLDIRRLSLRHLQELNESTLETVHLTLRQGANALYVEKLDSPQQLRIHSRIGATVPLYCTAVGKVMLAYMDGEERAKLLQQIEFKPLTDNTVRNLQELNAQLMRVRKNSYACDLEENELHIRCVAAPIWDHAGRVNASLSLTAPVVRMPMSRLRQLAPLVQEAGLKISRELGYQPRDLASRSAMKDAAMQEGRSIAKAGL